MLTKQKIYKQNWTAYLPSLCISAVLIVSLIFPTFNLQGQINSEAKSLFKRAMELNHRQNYATALNYLMKAYQVSPDILSEDDQGLLDNATKFLEAQIAQKPKNGEGHFQLAELLMVRGEDARALNHYKKVIVFSPDSPLALLAKSEIAKITQSQQQFIAAQNAVAAQPKVTPQTPTINPKFKKMASRVKSLEAKVKELQIKIKRNKAGEKEKFKKYEKMEQDYKKLKRDSALWKLSFQRQMSSGVSF